MSHNISEHGDMAFSDNEEPKANVDNEHSGNEDNDASGNRVDPKTSKKKIIRNPIPKLDAARLKNTKGVHTIENYFVGFKFNGKGHEKNDLDRVMKRMEHWAHRLFPKYQFDDFIEKTEALGSKKGLSTFLTKYRRDMLLDDIITPDNDINTVENEEEQPEPVDEFDLLIAQEIEKTKRPTISQTIQNNTPTVDLNSPQISSHQPITPSNNVADSEEIKKKIERNRQMAIQRRLAKIKADEEIKRRKIEQLTVNAKPSSPVVTTTVVDELIISPEKPKSPVVHERAQDDKINSTEDLVTRETIVIPDDEPCTGSQDVQEIVNNSVTHLDLNETSEKLLTNEELDQEIDDAVNLFLSRKRQST